MPGARDITCLLLDVHAVLDQLHLDGTQPQITSIAEAIMRESGSPYTLPGLISALDEVISQLTRATRHAVAQIIRIWAASVLIARQARLERQGWTGSGHAPGNVAAGQDQSTIVQSDRGRGTVVCPARCRS
jgi:hypothetical protein